MEYNTTSTTVGPEPTDLDILCGRSDKSIYHVGNISFRTLVGCCLYEYNNLPRTKRSRKSQLFEAIVDLILKSGGRFLKQQSNGDWATISVEDARTKVGQEFRDETKKPHILDHYSVTNTARIETHFISAHDFDWSGIVEACKHELFNAEQYDTDATMNDFQLDGAESDGKLDDDSSMGQILQEICSNSSYLSDSDGGSLESYTILQEEESLGSLFD